MYDIIWGLKLIGENVLLSDKEVKTLETKGFQCLRLA